MKIKIRTVAAVLAMAAFAGSASASNIVVNGDFENGIYTAGQPTNDTVPNGWILGPPSFAIQSNLNVVSTVNSVQGPESGSDYVTFQSPATSGRDCLYQDLATVAGQTYTISFWVGITSTSVGNNIGLDVEWDENTAGQVALDNNIYSYPSNTGPVAYAQYTFSEVATTTNTRIDFHAVDSNGAILLDNVSVTAQSAAPEPMTMLLTGSGLMLAGLLRVHKSRRRL